MELENFVCSFQSIIVPFIFIYFFKFRTKKATIEKKFVHLLNSEHCARHSDQV